jgi:hypothetical protein
MAGSHPPSRAKKTTANLAAFKHHLAFDLFSRRLELGNAVTIDYWWMDSSRFRISRKQRLFDPANFRNCVTHWWLAMQSLGLGHDPAQIRHLIQATCYSLLSARKNLQKAFLDAHLKPNATDPTQESLPEEVQYKINAAVKSGTRDSVRAALQDALGGSLRLSGEEVKLCVCTSEGLLKAGVDLVLEKGNDGLLEFVQRFDPWCASQIQKASEPWMRKFFIWFGEDCKVSFYRCYSNVWIDLIPWLRQNCGLDKTSERFLRFWHMQNQPLELADGTVVPDVFSGHVLSLHPLSGFLMKDPALCAVAGRFFGLPSTEHSFLDADNANRQEYWDFVGAILTAAYMYSQAKMRQESGRQSRPRSGGEALALTQGDRGLSEQSRLEELAARRGLVCSNCGGRLQSMGFEPQDSARATLKFACTSCHTLNSYALTFDEMRGLLE